MFFSVLLHISCEEEWAGCLCLLGTALCVHEGWRAVRQHEYVDCIKPRCHGLSTVKNTETAKSTTEMQKSGKGREEENKMHHIVHDTDPTYIHRMIIIHV